jgi:hypothetical protein
MKIIYKKQKALQQRPKGWSNASIKNRKMLAAFGIKNIFWMENKIKRFFAINQGGKRGEV